MDSPAFSYEESDFYSKSGNYLISEYEKQVSQMESCETTSTIPEQNTSSKKVTWTKPVPIIFENPLSFEEIDNSSFYLSSLIDCEHQTNYETPSLAQQCTTITEVDVEDENRTIGDVIEDTNSQISNYNQTCEQEHDQESSMLELRPNDPIPYDLDALLDFLISGNPEENRTVGNEEERTAPEYAENSPTKESHLTTENEEPSLPCLSIIKKEPDQPETLVECEECPITAPVLDIIDLGGCMISKAVLDTALKMKEKLLYEIAKFLFSHLFSDEECENASRSGRSGSAGKLCPVKYVAVIRIAVIIKFSEGDLEACLHLDRKTLPLISNRSDTITRLNSQLGEHRNQRNQIKRRNRPKRKRGNIKTKDDTHDNAGPLITFDIPIEWSASCFIPMRDWALAHLHALEGKMAHIAETIHLSIFTAEELMVSTYKGTKPDAKKGKEGTKPLDPLRLNAVILMTRWLLDNVQADPYKFPPLTEQQLQEEQVMTDAEQQQIRKKVFVEATNQFRQREKRKLPKDCGNTPAKRRKTE